MEERPSTLPSRVLEYYPSVDAVASYYLLFSLISFEKTEPHLFTCLFYFLPSSEWSRREYMKEGRRLTGLFSLELLCFGALFFFSLLLLVWPALSVESAEEEEEEQERRSASSLSSVLLFVSLSLCISGFFFAFFRSFPFSRRVALY